MTIFLVKSNLKHDGEVFATGSFMEGDQGRFQSLVNDKVLEVVEGAETFDEAKAIVEKKNAEKVAEEQAAEDNKPQDTWAPTKEEDTTGEEDKTPEDAKHPAKEGEDNTGADADAGNTDAKPYDGPMGKYKITGDAFYTDEDGTQTGEKLEIGSVQDLPKPIGDTFVEKGVAEEVSDVDTNL
jgi:hypothetical protein